MGWRAGEQVAGRERETDQKYINKKTIKQFQIIIVL